MSASRTARYTALCSARENFLQQTPIFPYTPATLDVTRHFQTHQNQPLAPSVRLLDHDQNLLLLLRAPNGRFLPALEFFQIQIFSRDLRHHAEHPRQPGQKPCRLCIGLILVPAVDLPQRLHRRLLRQRPSFLPRGRTDAVLATNPATPGYEVSLKIAPFLLYRESLVASFFHRLDSLFLHPPHQLSPSLRCCIDACPTFLGACRSSGFHPGASASMVPHVRPRYCQTA